MGVLEYLGNSQNSFEFNPSTFNPLSYIDFSMILLFGLVLLIGFFTYKIVQGLGHPIHVLIHSKRAGGNLKIHLDRGKYFKDFDGITKFHLLKLKLKIKPPSKKDLLLQKSLLGSKEVLYLQETDVGQYIPMKISQTNLGNYDFTSDDIDSAFWMSQKSKEVQTQYETRTFFEKYGQQIGILMLGAFSLVIIIFMS